MHTKYASYYKISFGKQPLFKSLFSKIRNKTKCAAEHLDPIFQHHSKSSATCVHFRQCLELISPKNETKMVRIQFQTYNCKSIKAPFAKINNKKTTSASQAKYYTRRQEY